MFSMQSYHQFLAQGFSEPAYMFVVIYIKDLGFSVLISNVLLIVHLFLAPLIIWIHFHIIGTPVSYIIVSKGFVWKMDLQQANLYFDNSFILTDFVGWKVIVLITCQYKLIQGTIKITIVSALSFMCSYTEEFHKCNSYPLCSQTPWNPILSEIII